MGFALKAEQREKPVILSMNAIESSTWTYEMRNGITEMEHKSVQETLTVNKKSAKGFQKECSIHAVYRTILETILATTWRQVVNYFDE